MWKIINIAMLLFVLFPLATVAVMQLPIYHPAHPLVWFWGGVAAIAIATATLLTSLLPRK